MTVKTTKTQLQHRVMSLEAEISEIITLCRTLERGGISFEKFHEIMSLNFAKAAE